MRLAIVIPVFSAGHCCSGHCVVMSYCDVCCWLSRPTLRLHAAALSVARSSFISTSLGSLNTVLYIVLYTHRAF